MRSGNRTDQGTFSENARNTDCSGMMTRRCADTAVRSAADHAYQAKPAKDACAAMDLNLNGEIIPADTVRKALIAALDGAFAAII